MAIVTEGSIALEYALGGEADRLLTFAVEGRAMKRQESRKTAAQPAVATRRIAVAKRKLARGKLDKSAQMPNYLVEEHLEFGK